MCGITGQIRFDHSDIDIDQTKKMIWSLRHRGPEQLGIYLFSGEGTTASLGIARLQIIDLLGGIQPLANEDQSLWIVFNGEIYNYLELRTRLMMQGHTFKTKSDTEVILHLYEEEGAGCVHSLNGQFAFAIWDEKEEELFVARDRFGIRPFFFFINEKSFIFASEIKAILSSGLITPQLSCSTLDEILTYWGPLNQNTIFKGIVSLPPGHTMQIRKNGSISTKEYWQSSFSSTSKVHLPIEEAVSQFRNILIDAVRMRLRADVPIGVYMSGGIDSASIASITKLISGTEIETFSINFEDPKFDEEPYQKIMVNHLQTKHHSLRCSYLQIGESFPEAMWHIETPIMRTAPIPLFLLSSLVKSTGIKVVLTGEGADEILGGYDIFKESSIRRFWAKDPTSEARPLLFRRLYPYISTLNHQDISAMKISFGHDLTRTDDLFYSHAIRWRSRAKLRMFLSRDCIESIEQNKSDYMDLPKDFEKWHPLEKAQFLEIKTFLSGYLLSSQGDRPSMANSIESRYPFLDHRLVQYANALPPDYKLLGLREKIILKKAVETLIPSEIVKRTKHPFRAPIQQSFFSNGKPLPWMEEVLSASKIKLAGIFNYQAVTKLLYKIQNSDEIGEIDSMALSLILSTQTIFDSFVSHFRISDFESSTRFFQIERIKS